MARNRKWLMNWEGHPNYRWIKDVEGKRYRVTPEELAGPGAVRTPEATWMLANAWLTLQLAEANRPTPEQAILDNLHTEELRRLIEKGQAAKQLHTAKKSQRRGIGRRGALSRTASQQGACHP